MSTPPIVVAGLNHAFGKGDLRKQILFDVGVEIRSGEIVIVTGPSGSGKTTLLTLVGALRSAQEGSVQVLGEELRDARPATLEKVRRRIGFIFQQHNLLGALTALQNVELGVRASGRYPKSQHRERAREMLNAVGMGERLDHRPDQLSGGQRQRVAIGRAIVRGPEVFLFDEPLSNLDAKLRVQMRSELGLLHARLGTTTVYVTHDQVEAMTMGDRVAVLKDGLLQQVDTPLNLYDTPGNVFVAGFIGSPPTNFLDAERLGRKPPQKITVGVRPEHIRLVPETDADFAGTDAFTYTVDDDLGAARTTDGLEPPLDGARLFEGRGDGGAPVKSGPQRPGCATPVI